MTDNVTRENVLAAIAAERKYWDDLVGEVGSGRAEQTGVMGDWTFKDLAAHLTMWRQRTIDRLDAAANGRPAPPPPWPAELGTDDVDTINDWIHKQHHNRPLDDVLRDARESYDHLARVVGAFSDDELNDPGRFEWMDGQALGPAIQDGSLFDHLHEEHEADIREFRAAHE